MADFNAADYEAQAKQSHQFLKDHGMSDELLSVGALATLLIETAKMEGPKFKVEVWLTNLMIEIFSHMSTVEATAKKGIKPSPELFNTQVTLVHVLRHCADRIEAVHLASK